MAKKYKTCYCKEEGWQCGNPAFELLPSLLKRQASVHNVCTLAFQRKGDCDLKTAKQLRNHFILQLLDAVRASITFYQSGGNKSPFDYYFGPVLPWNPMWRGTGRNWGTGDRFEKFGSVTGVPQLAASERFQTNEPWRHRIDTITNTSSARIPRKAVKVLSKHSTIKGWLYSCLKWWANQA